MIQKSKGELVYLQFPAINETGICRHLFSTRLGGVSEGYLGSMNLSYDRGDRKENVDENYRRIADVLQTDVENFVLSDQTHTTNIRVVTKEDRGKGILKPRDYHDIDGLVTGEKNIVLTTLYADCVPLYFVDPVKKAIGLSHSGWKGTVNRMGLKTVLKMRECFGSRPEDLVVCIGPSICGNCYEVGRDVYARFLDAFQDAENLPDIVTNFHEDGEKACLNLWEANLAVLSEAGVRRDHISLPGICTCCHSDFLFSHRASRGKRGNLAAFLMLN